MVAFNSLVVLALAAAATAVPTTTETEKRAASCSFPSPPKTSSLTAAKTISAGTTFDGGNVRFDRGSGACKGQSEGGDKDAVFILQEGSTLSNVVIGANQMEGVHCLGSCTLKNVWFDVCEDAITIKQTSGTSTISGGGAKNADDKIVQHNGGGTVVIDSFCAQTFGKLYRSCGNCSTQYKRTSKISNIIASSGSVLAGINSNYGDTSTLSGLSLTSVKSVCDTFTGNSSGAEPPKLTSNVANAYCKF
ncbi:polysaccharide lyase family 3 protein [Botryobasidium botryosum FD-172 SS1]|uniref:Pectate lyase n=1 Tax=Botryobasidium botryosum (strain FD-172 SS1) TaxID=930990 RepID=A0A067MJS4_BOTB1|nr:polysaccharide lyase family 3 protein [Botryobasidium botryosum FD-172 SS1]